MLYTAKCYWPGVTADELEQAGERAFQTTAHARRHESSPTYVGSILFPGDDLVLCLFDATSHAAVKRASERAGIPCERVMDTLWLAPASRGGTPLFKLSSQVDAHRHERRGE
jgi:hypothetical protein